MNHLLSILKSVIPSAESQSARDDAYLAGASDLNDLERRVRDLESRARVNWSPIAYGLYNR